MKREYAKSKLTRRKIMDSAIAVFAEHGFAGGSTSAIAQGADVSEAQVFYHYGSKQALLVSVLEERDRRADDFRGPNPETAADIPNAVLRVAADNATNCSRLSVLGSSVECSRGSGERGLRRHVSATRAPGRRGPRGAQPLTGGALRLASPP